MTKNKNKTKTVQQQQKAAAPRQQPRAPGVPNITGQGGYMTDAFRAAGKTVKGLIPKGSFSAIGQAGGSAFGPLGGKLGALLGGKIASIAGFGAYHVSQNSLMARVDEGVDLPQFHNAEHATIVRHREFVMDIGAAGTAFTNTVLPINPGLAASFPYLAQIASSFESYQVLGMIFEFRSTSSDNTSGGALGSVVLATEYNVVDASYPNKLIMENAEYSMSSKPSHDVVHAVECDPSVTFSPIKFVRNSAVPSGKDPRLYDWGNFQIATVGLPTSSGNLGELWVSYEIAFFKPSLSIAPALGACDHFKLPTTIAAGRYMAADTVTVMSPTAGSTIGGTILGSAYRFPPGTISGNYMITYIISGASTNITQGYSLGNYNNIGGLVNLYGNSSAQVLQNTGTTGQIIVTQAFQVVGPNASFAITGGTIPTSCLGGDLFVQMINSTY